MKEQRRQFCEKDFIEEAIMFLDAWCKDAENSAIKPLKKIAKALMHHSQDY